MVDPRGDERREQETEEQGPRGVAYMKRGAGRRGSSPGGSRVRAANKDRCVGAWFAAAAIG